MKKETILIQIQRNNMPKLVYKKYAKEVQRTFKKAFPDRKVIVHGDDITVSMMI